MSRARKLRAFLGLVVFNAVCNADRIWSAFSSDPPVPTILGWFGLTAEAAVGLAAKLPEFATLVPGYDLIRSVLLLLTLGIGIYLALQTNRQESPERAERTGPLEDDLTPEQWDQVGEAMMRENPNLASALRASPVAAKSPSPAPIAPARRELTGEQLAAKVRASMPRNLKGSAALPKSPTVAVLVDLAAEAQELAEDALRRRKGGIVTDEFEAWRKTAYARIADWSKPCAVEFQRRLQDYYDSEPMVDGGALNTNVLIEVHFAQKAQKRWQRSAAILSDLHKENLAAASRRRS